MSNRIQELIMLLEEEIEQSPKPRLGNGNKRVIDCDRILDILGDIKVVLPEEMRLAQTVLSEREEMLAEAEQTAVAILAEARIESERMISNDYITIRAKQNANAIIDRAEANAAAISDGARKYSQEILEDVQRYLHEYIEIVAHNREDLNQQYRSMHRKTGYEPEPNVDEVEQQSSESTLEEGLIEEHEGILDRADDADSDPISDAVDLVIDETLSDLAYEDDASEDLDFSAFKEVNVNLL